MKLERKIASYLVKYGNTRECDLIGFGVRESSCSNEDVKKTISRMVVKGKIHRIVHSKLEPPEVYISIVEPSPGDFMEGLFEVPATREVEESANEILREAEIAAERRMKERFPEELDNESKHKQG